MFGKTSLARLGVVLCTGAAAAAGAPTAAQAAAPQSFRVGLSDSGGQIAAGTRGTSTISADGSTVLFDSGGRGITASCPGSAAGHYAVFTRDLLRHRTECVSVATDGTVSDQDAIGAAASGDGSRVLFTSAAGNLPHAAGVTMNAYLRDRRAGTTTQVNLDAAGKPFDAGCIPPTISADGSTVAMYGGWGVGHAGYPLYLRNLLTGKVTTVPDVQVTVCGATPALSADGTVVVYRGLRGKARALLRLDTRTGVTTVVNDQGANPQVSADGSKVAFDVLAPQLAADTNRVTDAYVTRFSGDARVPTRLLSTRPDGQSGNGESLLGGVSPNGRYVAFVSAASDLVPGDTNRSVDVFVRDLVRGTVARVSVPTSGAQAPFGAALIRSGAVSVTTTPTGKPAVTFATVSSLVAPDTNGLADVYVRR